jgi:hypothetical protein
VYVYFSFLTKCVLKSREGREMKRWAAAIAGVVFLTLAVWVGRAGAQTANTATVLGTVTDPSGAVIGGATVTLTNTGTGISQTTAANSAGQYTFPSVRPGTYSVKVTMTGFQTATVPSLVVNVSKSYQVNFKMVLGQVSKTVIVQATAAVQLQTTSAQVGNVVGGNEMMRLPTLQHNAAELVSLQPAVTPGSGGFPTPDVRAAGAMDDQNTYTLDGIDISDNLVGNGTWLPVPLDSVQEFDIGVADPNSTFGRSSGAQIAMVARHGTNQYHGAVYWYHQNDELNANPWENNRAGIKRTELKDNRGGFRLGGPIWKGKTFFFVNYELRRFPQSQNINRIVPSDALRNGILQFADGTGHVIQYPLATSMLCGTAGNQPCDPRGIGISPSVQAFWNLMPKGNDTTLGDGLNYVGYRGVVSTPIQDDYGVLRLDHAFNEKWHFSGSYTFYRDLTNGTQVSLLNKTVTSVNPEPNRTTMITTQLSTQIRPNLINTFSFGWIRNWNGNNRLSPTASASLLKIPGTSTPDGPIAINPAENLLGAPIDNTSSNARFQDYFQKNVQFNDSVDWIKGNHTFQFGGTILKLPLLTDRADKVVNGITSLVAVLNADAGATFLTSLPNTDRPPTCSGSLTSNCLQSASATTWDELYAGTLGLLDNISVLSVRDGNLKPLPFGTPLSNNTVQYATFFYGQDTYRVTNALTMTYGLSYGWQTPPSDTLGRQTVLINNTTNQSIIAPQYMGDKMASALAGQVYNPQLAYDPVKSAGRPVFNTDRSNVAPRISLAWNPSFSGGVLGKFFGDRKTVLRGGYSMIYARSSTIESVVIPMLGVGFGQTISVGVPNCNVTDGTSSSCNAGSTDPAASLFRVGVDGTIPTPTVPTINSPVVPSTPFGELLSFQDDPNMKVGRSENFDFTVQRELPGGMLLEVGWIGNWASRLPTSLNLANNPYFFVDKASGQSFAKAFDTVATELRNGQPVTPQAWFEDQLPGLNTMTGSFACKGETSVTACLSNKFGPDFVQGLVSSLFEQMDLSRALRLNLPAYDNLQSLLNEVRTYIGTSNYNGMIVTLHKQTSHGLMFDLNYTLSRALDDGLINQNNAGFYSNGFTPNVSWGPTIYDRTHVFSGAYVYNLPAGHGHFLHFNNSALDKFLSGWYTSGVFSAASGLPITVTESGQVWGNGLLINGNVGEIPTGSLPSGGVNSNVTYANGVSSAGDPTNKGTGLNLFSNPSQVLASFRPVFISSDLADGRANPIRGLGYWNLDASLGKTTTIHENLRFDFSAQFLNVFNHVNFNNPSLSSTSPSTFGVLTSEMVPANRTAGSRWIELGMRIEF